LGINNCSKKVQKSVYSFYGRLAYWEWLMFERRIDVRCTQIVANYPKTLTNEELLAWYKKYYPNDRESQMYARQNVSKWLKYD